MIEDIHTYTFKVKGFVDLEDINASSPVKLSVDRVTESATELSACSDQSGLIGIIRYLHSLGFVLLSIQVNETSR